MPIAGRDNQLNMLHKQILYIWQPYASQDVNWLPCGCLVLPIPLTPCDSKLQRMQSGTESPSAILAYVSLAISILVQCTLLLWKAFRCETCHGFWWLVAVCTFFTLAGTVSACLLHAALIGRLPHSFAIPCLIALRAMSILTLNLLNVCLPCLHSTIKTDIIRLYTFYGAYRGVWMGGAIHAGHSFCCV